MQIKIGLENGYEGRSLAWALDHPGCFAYGSDGPAAVVNMAAAFLLYKGWIGQHTSDSWLADVQDVHVRLVETWEVYEIDADFETVPLGDIRINAWFRHDWKPLTRLEVKRGLQVLAFSRADLLKKYQNLSDEILDRTYPGERWSIRGILRHIATAEFWYLDRLGLSGMNRRDLPEDVFESLEIVRRRAMEALSAAEGSKQVVGVSGEFWSPRKVLRRIAWHELDHNEHIQKLLEQQLQGR